MLQLMKMFEKWNYKITFLTTASNKEFSEEISFIPIQLNDEGFDQLILKLSPDIVLFDRFVTEEQFGWRVSDNCPNAVKILDTEDLHFLREARKTAFKEKRIFEEKDYYNEVFKREMASVLRCDLSLIISEFEYKLLTEKFKINSDILFYLPFLFDGNIPESKPFSERKHFFSIGNFLHEPNFFTVLFLKKYWKKIRKKLPEAELHIYGAYPSEKVFQLHNEKEGFIVKGRVESSKEVFENYRILLAPIPFGAGLKGKLFESMTFGMPNVTTSIGAEGMNGNLEWNGFIGDHENDFIEKSVLLYSDENLWESCRQNGYVILKERFSETVFVSKLKEKIFSVQNNLEHHRSLNFMGQILQHHQMNATKYLSRWIEEKNRKK